jgi:uncharacterized membrane protein YkgB
MILEMILVGILLYICLKYNETMQCEDVVLKEPPLSSIYDVKNGKNEVFKKEKNRYTKELKQYFKEVKTYCFDK